MTFSDGSTVTYTYAADGPKLCTMHTINDTTTQKDYCGSVIYENGAAKLWQTEAGYISMNDSKYHYYLQDHQGNNRVVVNETGATEEVNHYYAFGGLFGGSSVQPFKYNGKELDTKKGLNWYDYGARHYDAALGRFTTIDPKAEDLMKWSLYSYCYDNPINFIDPDGKRGRPVQRAIRRGLRNSGSSSSIYGFFNLPKPQSTQTVITYKYRGGMLREQMALGEQNYLLTIQTLGAIVFNPMKKVIMDYSRQEWLNILILELIHLMVLLLNLLLLIDILIADTKRLKQILYLTTRFYL